MTPCITRHNCSCIVDEILKLVSEAEFRQGRNIHWCAGWLGARALPEKSSQGGAKAAVGREQRGWKLSSSAAFRLSFPHHSSRERMIMLSKRNERRIFPSAHWHRFLLFALDYRRRKPKGIVSVASLCFASR